MSSLCQQWHRKNMSFLYEKLRILGISRVKLFQDTRYYRETDTVNTVDFLYSIIRIDSFYAPLNI